MKNRMPAIEYRKLCRTIHSMYKFALDMSYMEACELADCVFFGEMTEAELMDFLKDLANDELCEVTL